VKANLKLHVQESALRFFSYRARAQLQCFSVG